MRDIHMKNILLLPVLAVFWMSPAVVFASHPLVTEDTVTVAPSKFEAESSVEFATGTVDRFTIQETVKGGISPDLDAFFSVPFSSMSVQGRSDSGFSDVTFGIKWKFMNVDNVSFAVKPFLVLPVGNGKNLLESTDVGFGAVGVASLAVDKKLTVDANLVLKHQPVDGDWYNEFGVSVAGRFNATKECKAVGEIVLLTRDGSGSKTLAFMGIGAVYEIQKNLDVDIGLRAGLTNEAEDVTFLAGVTCKF